MNLSVVRNSGLSYVHLGHGGKVWRNILVSGLHYILARGLQSSVGVACRHRLLHNPMPFIPAFFASHKHCGRTIMHIIMHGGAHTMDRDNTM